MEAEAMPVFGAGMDVVRSPKKLGELIFDKWGYDPIATTAAGNRSTNKQSLMTLALENPDDLRFGAMMKLRKCNTKLSKFIGGTIKSIAYHGSNITRPCPAISGTMTGRFTYSSTQGKNKSLIQTGIALHQWERDKTTRDLLAAPPGFLLAEFDFSGQEMRLMAILSDDDVMLDLFESGGDGHAYMGSSIEGVDYDWVRDNADTDKNAKEIRNLGKFSNLSLQYRIGVDSIMARALTQYSLQLTRHKAQHIKTTYLNTYKRVPQYWKDAQAIAAEKGYAETLGGRRIPLNNLSSYQQQQTAINYPVQGTGGDMKSLALNVTRHLFDSNFIYGWDLHDALFVYIRNDRKAKGKIHAFRKILSNLPYEKAWGWTPVIDLPVDAKVGRTWGTLKALD
jgi:DNA polymerase-1